MPFIGPLLALATILLVAVFGPSDERSPRDIGLRVLAVLCAICVLLMTGCAGKTTKPDVPRGIIVKPKLVEVVRTEYVRVPAELTDPLPIAEGPLSLCPLVAADRRKTIEKANADRRATRALSGTEARK